MKISDENRKRQEEMNKDKKVMEDKSLPERKLPVVQKPPKHSKAQPYLSKAGKK